MKTLGSRSSVGHCKGGATVNLLVFLVLFFQWQIHKILVPASVGSSIPRVSHANVTLGMYVMHFWHTAAVYAYQTAQSQAAPSWMNSIPCFLNVYQTRMSVATH